MNTEERSSIRQVFHNGDLIAVYIPASHGKLGIEFATDNDATMQVGVLVHPKNKLLKAHHHLSIQRESRINRALHPCWSSDARVQVHSRRPNGLDTTLDSDVPVGPRRKPIRIS